MNNYLRNMIKRRNEGYACGIPSYCTANPFVIQACLEQAKRFDGYVLLEATANQVNQYGGYTGMTPVDYKNMVYAIAEKISFERERIILGGDHLGPLIWADLPENEAMARSMELVRAYISAGYTKIHLDTSMRLGDDPADKPLSDETIAQRGAALYSACQEAYAELLKKDHDAVVPVFVIGSEVPIPGGAQAAGEAIEVTKPESLENTLRAYESAFKQLGFSNAFEDIIGVVVQPGVEFSDSGCSRYDRAAAAEMTAAARYHRNIVLEGHSTDYQPAKALREMVEDGVAILKVGPALTYAFREGLFALSIMERELVPEDRQAHFTEILEQAMTNDPKYWQKYYHGSKKQQQLHRRYSFSDRCRYYLSTPSIEAAIAQLLENMNHIEIPLSMIHQYMPVQYNKLLNGSLQPAAEDLLRDYITVVTDDYNYAVQYGYDIAGVHY